MDFCEALKAMKMGSKVSREAWRGKIAHWRIEVIDDGPLLMELQPDGMEYAVLTIQPEDILAEDWWIVT